MIELSGREYRLYDRYEKQVGSGFFPDAAEGFPDLSLPDGGHLAIHLDTNGWLIFETSEWGSLSIKAEPAEGLVSQRSQHLRVRPVVHSPSLQLDTVLEVEPARYVQGSTATLEPLQVVEVYRGPTMQADAPACANCGWIMTRSGTCYRCENCGSTSGCS